ncbi:conserved hypothetical protein [Luteimonas sp. 9C]|uniref:hypothetical protein n=1 Tax=Luteimonas sp. 9C TaxID=2653148 RepID=UPI0012F35056|nr:hypothetical protein [Luteimonas sp. 9C]VXB36430.1 conserved hypothetical protein [Luteimonas sp. 9C]
MHLLRSARLISGTETPAGDGITGALRCVIEDDQGKKFAAVLKSGPLGEIAAEATASLLLSGWGLPVPQPYLVSREEEICFASADVGYPNLKKSLSWDHANPEAKAAIEGLAFKLVCGFKTMPLAAACDEAIDNRDRNLGNILWDGQEEVWIDHAFSFGIGNLPDANKLCFMAISAGATEEVQRSALAASMTLDRTLSRRVEDELHGSVVEMPELLLNVSMKLSSIGASLLMRFPQPEDLFGHIK